jgi:hypothetical protein
MSKKGGHLLLQRLLKVVDHRLPFQTLAENLHRQRQWLVDLDHLMELEQLPKPTCQSVSQAVDLYLHNLIGRAQQSGSVEDQAVVSQIDQIFRNLWRGLFFCYEVDGLPRTNNDLEQFIRRVKIGQRRISGHKNVQDFILRYGSFAAFVDYAENEKELHNRLALVSQTNFLKQRSTMNMIIVKEQKIHRFRFHRQAFLSELEIRWDKSVDAQTS